MTAPSLNDLRAISREEYRIWFERHNTALRCRSPFHHPAWLEAVGAGVRFEVVFVGVYQGRELVAVIPGFLTRRGPLALFGSPLRGTMTSYLGPIGLELGERAEELVDLISACSHFARKEWGAVYTRFTLRNAPNAPKEHELELGPDWEQQRPGSYRLDLARGEAALWAGLESDCRRNIRKAQRVGIETVPLDDARLFYEILDETLRRHGSASWHSERFFKLILAALIPRDLLWAWGARYEGSIIGAGLFFHDDQEMHFISGASRPEWGSLPTSYSIHWHAIETAARAGIRVFNSDASRISSIDQFKETFRPTLDERYTLIWAPNHVRYAQRVFLSSYSYLQRARRALKPA